MQLVSKIQEKLIDLRPGTLNIEIIERWNHLIVKKGARELIFFFDGNQSSPVCFTKSTRLENNFEAFNNEYEMLQFVTENAANDCSVRVPRPYALIAHGNALSITMSFLEGQPVNLFNRWNFLNPFVDMKDRKTVSNVLDWWKSFIKPHVGRIPIERQYLSERLEKAIKRYHLSYPVAGSMKTKFEAMQDELKNMAPKQSYLAPVHGDFWSGNLLKGPGGIVVLDWERGQKLGLPFLDILLFCFTSFQEDGSISAMAKSFLGKSRINRLIKQTLSESSSFLALEKDLMKFLTLLFMIEMTTQGLMHYGAKTIYDEQWNERMSFFLENRDAIFLNSFSPSSLG